MLRLRDRASSAIHRFKIEVRVTLGRAKSVADTRETFWSSYRAESSSLGDARTYSWYEQRLRSNFPVRLQDQLRREIPDISVVFSELRYGSLDITLTAISAGFAGLALTNDDAARLIQQYVPLAFAETLEPGPADLDFETRVQSEAGALTSRRPEISPNSPKLAAITAPVVLLLVAALLLGATVLLFRAANETRRDVLAGALADQKNLNEAVLAERARLTDALIKERAALTEERRARVAELNVRVKALEGQIADLNGRWAQLVAKLQEARAKAAPNPKPSRRR